MDDISGLPEPAQIAILSNLDINSLYLLTESDPKIKELVSTPYVLEELAKARNLPTPSSFEEFQDYSIFGPELLLRISARRGCIRVLKALTQDTPDEFYWVNALGIAAENNHIDAVRIIMDLLMKSKRIDLEMGRYLGNVMRMAVGNRNDELYELMMTIREKLSRRDLIHLMIGGLEGATMIGDLKLVKSYLEQADEYGYGIVINDPYFISEALHMASELGHTEIQKYLYIHGAISMPRSYPSNQITETETDYQLLESAIYRDDLNAVRYMINSGRIKELDKDELSSAIMTALEVKQNQMAALLMNLWTPLIDHSLVG